MYVLKCEADIAGKRFSRVHSVKIEQSLARMGAMAIIELPTTARLERSGEFVAETETAKIFQVGDPVTIRAGYDDRIHEEFKGYVRRISPSTPLRIECEDDMFQLRRRNLRRSWRSTTLAEVLSFIVAGTSVELVGELPQIDFTKFYLKNVTAARALKQLRDKYGLTIYFRKIGELFVGLASDSDDVVIPLTIGRNVIDHDLEWVSTNDVRLRIKAIRVSKSNELETVEVGDPEGELRTLYFYDLAPGDSLEERAREELVKYSRTGYRGTLRTFLRPRAAIGNVARLRDELFANREGDYLVEKVSTTINSSGGRRRIEPTLRVG
jgi:hypothetical protein